MHLTVVSCASISIVFVTFVYSRFRYWYCDSCLISFSLSISFVILLGICGYYASCYRFDHAQCVGSTTLSKIWVKLVRYALENKTKHKSIRVMEKVEIKKMRYENRVWVMRNEKWKLSFELCSNQTGPNCTYLPITVKFIYAIFCFLIKIHIFLPF